jgi:hypothetical protein
MLSLASRAIGSAFAEISVSSQDRAKAGAN